MKDIKPPPDLRTTPAILFFIRQRILSDSVIGSSEAWRFKDIAIGRSQKELFHLAKKRPPDVILVDALSGFGELRKLLRSVHLTCPNAQIIVFNSTLKRSEIMDCLTSSVSGCLSSDAPLESLEMAIDSVSSGHLYFSASVAQFIHREYARRGKAMFRKKVMQLSAREEEIISMLAKQMTNKQIAAKLGISVRSVEKHRENIGRKFKG